MAITSTQVLNLAPELSSVPSDRMNWALGVANARLSDSVLGAAAADLARAYYAAHLLSLRSDAGTVTSESAGGISRSYAAAGDNPLDLTAYGREYRRLIKGHASRVGVVS